MRTLSEPDLRLLLIILILPRKRYRCRLEGSGEGIVVWQFINLITYVYYKTKTSFQLVRMTLAWSLKVCTYHHKRFKRCCGYILMIFHRLGDIFKVAL